MRKIKRQQHNLLKYLFENKDKYQSTGIPIGVIMKHFGWNHDDWRLVITELHSNKEIIRPKETDNISLTNGPGVIALTTEKYRPKFNWWNLINTLIAAAGLIIAIYALNK